MSLHQGEGTPMPTLNGPRRGVDQNSWHPSFSKRTSDDPIGI